MPGKGPDVVVSLGPSARAARARALVQAMRVHGPVELVDADGARRAGPLARARLKALGIPHALTGPAAVRLDLPADVQRLVAHGPEAAAALLAVMDRRPVVYSALGPLSEDDLPPRERRLVRSFERGVLRAAAEVWVPSRAERREIRRRAPDARVRVVPDVVDVDAVGPEPRPRTATDARLHADLSAPEGRAAFALLRDEVLPRVWRGHGDVTLSVFGPAEPPAGADERIRHAEDPYAGAGCIVLIGPQPPPHFAEVLARALPVVATPDAARGTGAAAGMHFFESPASALELAIALVEALKGIDAARVGSEGRALVEREHAVASITRLLAPGAPLG